MDLVTPVKFVKLFMQESADSYSDKEHKQKTRRSVPGKH